MRVLVVGGAGFIGSHIVEHFSKQEGVQVRVLDNFRSGYRHNLEPFDVELFEGSITDKKLVDQSMKDVDYVFHLAAMVSVPESVESPFECVELNVTGTLNLLQAAAKHKVKKLILSSSAAIYGDDPALPKVETMAPKPLSPYAVTKLDGEYYLELYRKHWGIETASLRYFNVFGPRQDPKSAYAAAIPIFASKATDNEDITIFGDGQQTRDFVYVKDVVQANVLLMEKGHGSYNVGCNQTITIKELAEKIIEVTNSRSKIVFKPERKGDIKHSRADVSKLQALGFAPKVEWGIGLEKTVKYFQE